MFGTHDLALFIISGLLLNMAPGPDSLLIMTHSARQGFRAGSSAALGIGAGTFVHVFAAALGLSALLATSATAFSIIKYIGAAYLLYIGLRMLFSKAAASTATPVAEQSSTSTPYRKIFLQGFLTNILNPKIALFFLAFVPQFVSPESDAKALAFIALGSIFNFNGMLWCHLLAAFTAFFSRRISIGRQISTWLNRLIGGLFVSFGVKLALAGRQ